MLLFHGDNQVVSRKNLQDRLKRDFSGTSIKIVRVDGKKVTLTQIKQNTENSSLFGEKNILVLENFFARPKSNDVTQITTYLKSNQDMDIIFWEGKKISPTHLKIFKITQIIEAKISRLAYVFLENLGSSLPVSLQQLTLCLAAETAGSLLYAVSNHVRQLLTLEVNPKIAPWLRSKLASQKQKLGEPALLWLHTQLLEIDYRNKTGASMLSLESELELVIIGLYHKKYERA